MSQDSLDADLQAVEVVVIWGVLTHPPQIIQKIMFKKIEYRKYLDPDVSRY